MYSQLEDFLLPGFLELGGDWVLIMSTSPATWSGNIPEGIAPNKIENRRSIQRYTPQGPSQLPGAYSSGIPSARRTILVSAGPREWPGWEWPGWEWPIHKPALLRLGEISAYWGLLKLVMKII